MSARDAFGLERPDDGLDEVVELQQARRIPPAFCWTEDEFHDLRHGYVTEGELRAKHDRVIEHRQRQADIEAGLCLQLPTPAGDARAEWAEYGWPQGRASRPEYDPAEDADSELTGGTGAPPEAPTTVQPTHGQPDHGEGSVPLGL